MRKKILSYTILPIISLALIGAGTASAKGFLGFGNLATPEEVARRHTEMFQQQADLLGASLDEVKNAWAQGKTLQELAAEKGLSQDQIRQKMADFRKQQMKGRLQILVNQGVITQVQADQRSQIIDQQDQNGKFGGKGHGPGFDL